MTAKDARDIALHAAGGALIAALCVGVACYVGSVPPAYVRAVALLWALCEGVTRESDQRRGKAFWKWSAHAWIEAFAWPVGALVVWFY